MASSIEYILKLSSNGNTVLGQLQKKTDDWSNSLKGVGDKFATSMDMLKNTAVFDNLDRASQKLNSVSESGASLNQNMAELSAITGVSDTALGSIESAARKAAIAFGTDAAKNVESYNTLLSELSPTIANNIPALESMGNHVNILSKQMGGDTQASASLLSTAMNQFGVDLTDPIQAAREMGLMMNVMSKGAKEGSAKLPSVGAALEKAGANAQLANVSFAETNASIQILDKAGKKGAEGGTALANVMSIIGKGRFMPKETLTALQAAGVDVNKLSDKSLSFGQRLQQLKPILKDSALLQTMFGEGATVAGYNLIQQSGSIDSFAKSLEGSNDAQRQADIIMNSFNEKQKRHKAMWDDLKISIFNVSPTTVLWTQDIATAGLAIGEAALAYNSFMTFLKSDGIVKATQWISNSSLALKAQALWTGISTTATNMLTASWWAANGAMLAIPITVAAIIGAIGYVVYKTDGWSKAWDNLVEGFKSGGQMLVSSFKLYAKVWLEPWMFAFDQIRIGWYSVKSLWSDTAQSEIAGIRQAAEERRKGIVDNANLVKQQFDETKKHFSDAGNSLSWNKDKSVTTGVSSLFNSSGQTATTVPKTNQPNFVPTVTPTGNGKAGGAAKSTTDSIATGGTKSTNITINLMKEVVGTISINTQNLKESTIEIERQVAEALTRVLANAALHVA